MELTSLTRDTGPRTLLVKDISYNSRYDVIDSLPGGEELRMCLLTKTSLGDYQNIDATRQILTFMNEGENPDVRDTTCTII